MVMSDSAAVRTWGTESDSASAAAVREMSRYWLSTPSASAKTVRFIRDYRAYVINYNLGRDLVADWVARTGGAGQEGRWRMFGALLSSPMLPHDLLGGSR